MNDPNEDVSASRYLVGSGRSGTTWLQEVACRAGNLRPVFEPFFAERQKRFADIPQGWYLPPEHDEDDLKARVEEVLSGRYRTLWADHIGSMVRRRATRGRVVKDIRTLPWLGWMARSFPEVRTAHVLRHPLAVVSSSTELGWKPAHFDRMITSSELVSRHLRGQIGWLSRLETDWEKTVAAWCIENRVAIRETEGMPSVARFSYEALVADEDEVQAYLAHLEIEVVSALDTSRASRLSRPESLASHVGYAKPYWRDSLTTEQLESALSVIERLGFGDVFHDDGAVDFSRLR